MTKTLGTMTVDTVDLVMEFHDTFGHPIKTDPDISDDALNTLRIDLLKEELEELKQALEEKDIVKVLDACLDLQYVLDGAMIVWGLALYKNLGFQEVHNSNMSKDGEDGKPIVREDGKILKGPNYFKPDLYNVIGHRL